MMVRFVKQLRAGLKRRPARARALRVRNPAACGYEAAWPALEPVRVRKQEGAQRESG